MSGKSISQVIAVSFAGLFVVWTMVGMSRDVGGQPPTEPKPKESLNTYMHSKLVHSQQVLGGLVTRNFSEIRKGAGALKQTSLDAPPPKGKDPLDQELYGHFKLEFLRLTTQLGEMADEQNLEGAAFAYQNLTANCMACHQFLEANRVRNAN